MIKVINLSVLSILPVRTCTKHYGERSNYSSYSPELLSSLVQVKTGTSATILPCGCLEMISVLERDRKAEKTGQLLYKMANRSPTPKDIKAARKRHGR